MLDLLATRYPNKRPSDYVDGLDSWQALDLDIALAVKYSTLEKEEKLRHTEAILASIDNVLRSNGAKVPKRKPFKSIIQPFRNEDQPEDDLPLIDDLVKELSGGATVVNMKGIE